MASKQRTLFETDEKAPKADNPLSGHTVRVVFDAGLDQAFDYIVPQDLMPVELCQRVEAPLGKNNKIRVGYCVGVDCKSEVNGRYKLKAIHKVVDKKPLLSQRLFELAVWISDYYVCPLGQVIAAMVPAAVKRSAGVAQKRFLYLECGIGEMQVEQIKEKLSRAKKQLAVVGYLEQSGAFSPKKAVEQSEIETNCNVSKDIVRKLIEGGNIGYIKREVVKSLPVIPEGLAIKSGGDISLNPEQIAALEHITADIDSGDFGVSLLHGVTDSGKTEIYIRAVERAIEREKKAIVLLPEIALTTQTIRRFSERFERLAVLHSGLTDAQRNSQWQNILSGQADVVVGARSAIFAPLADVGVIVVDEEHEGAYKQDVSPRYNGRDVAIKRSQIEGACCILGSATPALETLHNCQTKPHFKHLRLTKRVMDLPMPKIECVDLSKQTGMFFDNLISERLETELRNVLSKKEQAILLLNRRGYSNLVYCPSCKYILHCRNCDASLTFHRHDFEKPAAGSAMVHYRKSGYAICHYCGSKTLVPMQCPMCRSGLSLCGVGVQKLQEQLASKFPKAVVRRIDSDSMKSGDYYQLLSDFSEGRIDILAGTQILAKGLHFPNVTLVGIISADATAIATDFRVNERTFQLISQVSGRTGRGEKGGTVIIQTMRPEQPTIKYALNNDFYGFAEAELKQRKAFNLPPFSRMAIILMRDENHSRLEETANRVKQAADNIAKAAAINIRVLGPVDAPIPRINRNYRVQLVVFGENAIIINKFFKLLRAQPLLKKCANTVFDIDPV